MRIFFRRTSLLILVIIILAVGAISFALASAKLEITPHGVHKRLLIRGIAFPLYTGTGEQVFMPGHLDGPVVRRTQDGSWSARWYCQDQVGKASGTDNLLTIDCAGKTHAFPLVPVAVPPAIAPMPSKLVVLSDLEGNAEFLDSALRKLDIVNAAGDWQFGQGHLVVLGDSVDRGRDVFAVLWRLHTLAGQAHAAGGAVHVVLGNHEQYILRTNISRANREHLYALNEMGGYAQAFAADTVLGAWLRQQPVVLKLGSVLFTHGGIGPDVAKTGLSVDQLNDAMRGYWRTSAKSIAPSPSLDAVLGHSGVTQYRGYLEALEENYPLATQAEVDQMLKHFDASQIVVAHTLVDKVKALYQGKVYAIDVNSADALPEVLIYNDGIPQSLNIGVSRGLEIPETTRVRDFSVWDAADRQLLGDMYRQTKTLSNLPHPY